MNGNVPTALLLAAAAGLSTVVGSALGILVRKPGPRLMAVMLGFVAGVMLLVSFIELLADGVERIGFGWGHVAFFAGMAAMLAIDALIPHEYLAEREDRAQAGPTGTGEKPPAALRRTALLLALGIGIHNFPEGMATLGATLEDVRLGVAMAVAIAIHNIPEGLALSVPVFAATGSRSKAFFWSFLSGVAEPVGAGIAALVLMPILTPSVLAATLCVVAGFMVYISLDELVPASRECGHEHLSIVGAAAGMAVMALSLWLLG